MLDAVLKIGGTSQGADIILAQELANVVAESGNFTEVLALQEDAQGYEDIGINVGEVQSQYIPSINNFIALAEVQPEAILEESELGQVGSELQAEIAPAFEKQQLALQPPMPMPITEQVPLASAIEFPSTEAMLAYEANLDKLQLADVQTQIDRQVQAATVTSNPPPVVALDPSPVVVQVASRSVDAELEPTPTQNFDETHVEIEQGVEVVRLPVDVEIDAQEVELTNYSVNQPQEKGIAPEATVHQQVAMESFYTTAQKSYDRLLQNKVVDQIEYQVTKAFNGSNESIRFTLQPHNLGEVEILFNTEQKGGHTNISVLAERYGTLHMLGEITNQIESSLIDSGFKPESFSLNFGMQDSGKGQDKFMQARGESNFKEPEIVNHISNYSGYLFSNSDTINILV